MGIDLVRAPGLHPGAPYADAAVVPAGSRLVLLAGSCPIDVEGRTVAAGDLSGQTRACLANLRLALTATGAMIGDVAFLRVLVVSTDGEDLALVWRVVREAFGDHEPPGTLSGATALGWPGQLVEVEATAAIAG